MSGKLSLEIVVVGLLKYIFLLFSWGSIFSSNILQCSLFSTKSGHWDEHFRSWGMWEIMWFSLLISLVRSLKNQECHDGILSKLQLKVQISLCPPTATRSICPLSVLSHFSVEPCFIPSRSLLGYQIQNPDFKNLTLCGSKRSTTKSKKQRL